MTHIIQFSGGKDSTALVLWAKEQGWPFTAVFCDTGWEAPVTLEYVQHINETQLDGKLVTVKSAKYDGLADLSAKRKIVPVVRMRFCTEELKIKPFVKWMTEQAFDEVTVYQGIRANESHARSQMPARVYEPLYEAWIERPLFDWTAEQVFEMHDKHGIAPNPLYLQGSKRVGCWPCVMINKGELRRLSVTHPEIWDQIAKVENAVADGRSFFRPDYIPARFHTGDYTKIPRGGSAPETGTFPTWQDVKFYVTRPDQLDLWDDEPTRCLSVYNLCE